MAILQTETSKERNTALLLFGMAYTFFSSFGQTFILSLYVPSVEGLLQISNTGFGSLYAIATIGSALTLPWLGGWFDRLAIKPYALGVATALAAALLLLSVATNFITVLIAFYGLRLFGQGLMGHTAISAMARYFKQSRGKAIGLASLGYPAGEMIFPVLITFFISSFGWRISLQSSAVIILLLLIPSALIILNQGLKKLNPDEMVTSLQITKASKSLNDIIKNPWFGKLAPVIFMLGFTNTAIFFFQLKLGDARAWSLEHVAASISAFAIAGAASMYLSGHLVDRFSAKRLFPWFMFPYLLGLLVLISMKSAWSYPFALALMGISNGMGSTINNALIAEVYGVAVIGQVRSMFATIMVASTSLGPIAFGFMLDMQLEFAAIFTAVALVMLLSVFNAIFKGSKK